MIIWLLTVAALAVQPSWQALPVQHKPCVSSQIGFDYLLKSVDQVFHQYTLRFNRAYEEEHAPDRKQKKSTHAENVFAGNLHIKVYRDGERTAYVNESASDPSKRLVIAVPYKLIPVERVWDIHLKKEVPEVILRGRIEFFVDILNEEETSGGEKRVVPQLKLSVSPYHNIQPDRSCKYHPRYCQIVSELHGFVKRFITLNDELYFDHVSSARTLKGFMMNFNEQAKHNFWSSMAMFELKEKRLALHLGCTSDDLKQMHSRPVAKNQIEVSLAQNFLELLVPSRRHFDISRLVEIAKDSVPDLDEKLKQIGLRNLEGRIQVVDQPHVLAALKKDYQRPGVSVEQSELEDGLGLKKLDKVRIKQILFVQIEGPANSTDYTVVPLEFDFSFFIAFKPGLGSSLGPVPDVAIQFDSASAQVKDCEYVSNPYKREASDDDDDDSDEDEDDDDDEAAERKPTLKPLPASQLLCSLRSRANDFLKSDFEKQFLGQVRDYPNLSSVNAWYSLAPNEKPSALLCQGIQLRDLELLFEGGRFAARFNISESAFNMDAWCDHQGSELIDYDPRLLPTDPSQSESLARLLSSFERYDGNAFFHPLQDFRTEKYFFGNANHHERKFLGPVLHHLINYYPYKNWCERHYPEKDPVKCTTAFLFLKNNLDEMYSRPNAFSEYSDPRLGDQIKDWWQYLLNNGFYVALFLYIMKIDVVKRQNMPIAVFLANFAIQSRFFLSPMFPDFRFGPDTTAYLTQGAEFWHGQTDYKKISSMQGPCYYPGGHLWLYGLISRIFELTDSCDFILRLIHVLLQSACQSMVVAMALMYFKRAESHRVQMIGLLLVLNWRMHEYYQLLYNDAFLEFVIISSMFLASKNRPIGAVTLLSVAVSLKAGGLLLLPALLGWVQYQHGTGKLLLSLLAFFSIQVLAAAPFVSDTFCGLFGWKMGAQTSLRTYLERSKFLPSPLKRERVGSQYDISLWWRFIDESTYYKDSFLSFLQICMLSINIWYFFVRRNCLPQCLSQLASTFSGSVKQKMTMADRNFCVELLVITYIAGTCFVPGGHMQFFLWFIQLIPLQFMLIGFEPLVYFNWFKTVWPFEHPNTNMHHLTQLALSFYLLTLGPQFLRILLCKTRGAKGK